MLALCSVTALLGLVGRSPPPRMGGFQQRPGSTAPLGQARVGLLVRGSATAVEQLQDVCCGQASSDAPGIRGVIYRLADDSAEVVAEGEREALEQLASSVAHLGATLCHKGGLYCRTQHWCAPSGGLAGAGQKSGQPEVCSGANRSLRRAGRRHATLCFLPTGAEVREAWQQPLAQTGYAGEAAFPLVSLLTPKMRARIVLTGDPDSLDVFSSQLQVEAVFNRGLTLKKARPQPDRLEVCRLGPEP